MKREFLVDSDASMHVKSKCDLYSQRENRIQKSKECCKIVTANGSITMTEVAVDVRDLDTFVTAEVGKGQFFVTRPSINSDESWTLVCREHTQRRDNPDSKFVCGSFDYVLTEFGRFRNVARQHHAD